MDLGKLCGAGQVPVWPRGLHRLLDRSAVCLRVSIRDSYLHRCRNHAEVSRAPHPFIFELPPAKASVKEGEETDLGLVPGRAVELIPYIYLALEALGRTGLGATVPSG